MVTTRGSVLPPQWLLRLLSLLLYINLDALRILLSPLCLSCLYNQYVLLTSLTPTKWISKPPDDKNPTWVRGPSAQSLRHADRGNPIAIPFLSTGHLWDASVQSFHYQQHVGHRNV